MLAWIPGLQRSSVTYKMLNDSTKIATLTSDIKLKFCPCFLKWPFIKRWTTVLNVLFVHGCKRQIRCSTRFSHKNWCILVCIRYSDLSFAWVTVSLSFQNIKITVFSTIDGFLNRLYAQNHDYDNNLMMKCLCIKIWFLCMCCFWGQW